MIKSFWSLIIWKRKKRKAMDEVIKGWERGRDGQEPSMDYSLNSNTWSSLAFWTFVDESPAPVWSFSLFFYLTVVDLNRTQIKGKVTARTPACILEESDGGNGHILPWFRIETLTRFDLMSFDGLPIAKTLHPWKQGGGGLLCDHWASCWILSERMLFIFNQTEVDGFIKWPDIRNNTGSWYFRMH